MNLDLTQEHPIILLGKTLEILKAVKEDFQDYLTIDDNEENEANERHRKYINSINKVIGILQKEVMNS